jgi:hypothetical protein
VKGAAAGWRFSYSDRLQVRGDLDPIGAQKTSISLCPMFPVLFLKFVTVNEASLDTRTNFPSFNLRLPPSRLTSPRCPPNASSHVCLEELCHRKGGSQFDFLLSILIIAAVLQL